MKFLLEWEHRWNEGEGLLNFAALCREFGVSRQVGYDWVARYRAANHDVRVAFGAHEEAFAAAADEPIEGRRCARKLHPTWGPKKLRAWIQHHHPEVPVLAPNPLMIIDAHSRFLVRCEGGLDPDGREVQRIFDSAFQECAMQRTPSSAFERSPRRATEGGWRARDRPLSRQGTGGFTRVLARNASSVRCASTTNAS